MEYYRGGNVVSLIGSIQLVEVLALFQEMSLALGYMHHNEFVHRDVNSASVLIANYLRKVTVPRQYRTSTRTASRAAKALVLGCRK
jgi:serine/threonine protein kinase